MRLARFAAPLLAAVAFAAPATLPAAHAAQAPAVIFTGTQFQTVGAGDFTLTPGSSLVILNTSNTAAPQFRLTRIQPASPSLSFPGTTIAGNLWQITVPLGTPNLSQPGALSSTSGDYELSALNGAVKAAPLVVVL